MESANGPCNLWQDRFPLNFGGAATAARSSPACEVDEDEFVMVTNSQHHQVADEKKLSSELEYIAQKFVSSLLDDKTTPRCEKLDRFVDECHHLSKAEYHAVLDRARRMATNSRPHRVADEKKLPPELEYLAQKRAKSLLEDKNPTAQDQEEALERFVDECLHLSGADFDAVQDRVRIVTKSQTHHTAQKRVVSLLDVDNKDQTYRGVILSQFLAETLDLPIEEFNAVMALANALLHHGGRTARAW